MELAFKNIDKELDKTITIGIDTFEVKQIQFSLWNNIFGILNAIQSGRFDRVLRNDHVFEVFTFGNVVMINDTNVNLYIGKRI